MSCPWMIGDQRLAIIHRQSTISKQAENETIINNLRCDLEEATQQQQQPQEEQDKIRTLKQKLKEAEEMTELLVHKLDEQLTEMKTP